MELDFELAQKHNAQETLDQLLAGDMSVPELILLDLNLPGLSGLQFLHLARASEKLSSVPIVILSSTTNPKEIDHVIRSGANGYILKEFDVNLYASVLLENLAPYFK